MDALRTPDERFENLPGYPFEPRYLEVPDGEGGALRVHYLDEGPADVEPVLLMHGEPTWSYLYRRMIPRLVEAGHRVLAPDLVGFGRSDKPTRKTDYTYDRHVEWMRSWLVALDAHQVTLFGQDWGGMVGLGVLSREPERFARSVISNSALPVGAGRFPEAFRAWLEASQAMTEMPVGQLMRGMAPLTDEEARAYDAPFPDPTYQAGALVFPALAPPDMAHPSASVMAAVWEVLDRWEKPFLTAFSDGDPVTGGFDRVYRKRVPGARDLQHVTIGGAGHFVQEQAAPELVRIIDSFIRSTATTRS